jgi:hypothetical protein
MRMTNVDPARPTDGLSEADLVRLGISEPLFTRSAPKLPSHSWQWLIAGILVAAIVAAKFFLYVLRSFH